MATAEFPTDIGVDFLQCTVCCDTFKEPKTLIPCLHTFCKSCLKECVTKQRVSHLSCPLCRQEVPIPEDGVEGLKNNSFIASLVAAVQDYIKIRENPSKILCSHCDAGAVATSRCVECAEFLCHSCESAHRRLKSTNGHTRLTIDELQTGEHGDKLRAKRIPKCEVHPSKTVWLYCTTCDVPICRECAGTDHQEPAHQHEELSQAAAERKKTIKDLIARCQWQVQNLHKHEKMLAKMESYLEENEEKAKAEVTTNMKRLITIIQQEETVMLDSITMAAEQQRKKLQGQLEEKQTSLASAKRTCDFAMALAREGDIFEMLTFSKEIEQRLHSIAAQPSTGPGADLAKITVEYGSLKQQLKTDFPKNTKLFGKGSDRRREPEVE
ncbi:E3 ubiquitin-protein ligase TRIM56-like [Branchiostoma lanceolatum]|uniref:E3 ubiquitin-protein ligase TRIM56-like n=1 Tax=Branchiostoma lanceolatum TaxID=7740 RepID=UPI003451AA5A